MGRNADRNMDMRERTRRKLVDAAQSLLSSKGLHEAKVEDIARVAGVAKGLFYEHFENKDDIARHIALAIENELRDEILARLKRIPFNDLRAVLQTAFETYFEVIERNKEIALFFVREGRGVGVHLGQVILSMFNRLEALAFAQFERGLKAGLLRTSLNYRLLARAITGLLEQAAHYYLQHPEVPRRDAVQTLVEFSVAGVGARQEAHV